MTGHLSSELLRRMRARELSVEEIARVSRHAEACDACAVLVHDETADGVSRFQRELDAEPVTHPRGAQLRALAAGRLDAADREIVESHLEDCAACRSEIHERSPRAARVLAAAVATIAATSLLLWRGGGPASGQVETPRRAAALATTTIAAPRTAATSPWDDLVAAAIAAGGLPQAELARRVRVEPGHLRGTAIEPEGDVAPSGIVVESVRPTLTWSAKKEAEYIVSIFDGEDEIARSPRLTSATWRPARDLRHGRLYTWQVEVLAGDDSFVIPAPPAPQAVFAIVNGEAAAALAEARKTRPDDHILLAVLSAGAGLEREAARELDLAAAAGDPRAARLKHK
jgi:hypothetical protein